MTEMEGQYVTSSERTPEPMVERRRGPWGFWATIGLTLLIGVGYLLAQTVVTVVAIVVAGRGREGFDIEKFGESLTSNGFFLSAATCVAAPVVIGLSVLFAAISRCGTARDYLALRRPSWKTVGTWLLLTLLFIVAADSITYLIQGSIVPPSMVQVYETAYFVPLLWFAFILVAPFMEEILFRGFLFQGFVHTRLGPAGAIVLISILWAALHTQYDLYGIVIVFLGGLLLGYARLRTGSIYVPIIMHVMQNLVATIEVAISLR
jgi:hypothetical protein